MPTLNEYAILQYLLKLVYEEAQDLDPNFGEREIDWDGTGKKDIKAKILVQEALKPHYRVWQDPLPMDGEVRLVNDSRIHIYRGYLVSDRNKCMVHVKGEPGNRWVRRNQIYVPDPESMS